MTRFARAKGSKASNERVAEEATSWSEMKQQLDAKKEQVENQKKQVEADEQRKKNYDKFLKEVEEDEAKKSSWADFPGTVTLPEKTKKKKKKKKKSAEDISNEDANGVLDENVPKVDISKEKKRKRAKVKKVAEVHSNVEENLNVGEKKVAKKRKHNTEETNGQTKVVARVKKPMEEMTEEERKIFEKKKENKLKKLEKRKLMKKQQRTSAKDKKFDPNKEYKRRKPVEEVQKMNINGKDVEIVHFEGFPIKREDAERLKELRKQMVSKGLPRSEVKTAIKLERRRAEKSLARDKKSVCYNCRKTGHVLSECPAISQGANVDTAASGICFKCGSTEHTSFVCKVVKNQEFRFASCFICKEQGHISWQCPDNARGLYPKGGGCKLCGSVTHLKKDCPQHVAEQEARAVSLPTFGGDNPDSLESHAAKLVGTTPRVNKIIKF